MTARDHRGHALALFHRAFAPLLAVGRRYPALEEIIVDGPKLFVAAEEGLVGLDLVAETGLRLPDIRALCDNAAVYDGAQFGEVPPARPILSVKVPPELRVSASIPPVVDDISVAIRFLRSKTLTLDDYVGQGVMTQDQAAHLRRLLQAKKSIVVSGGTGTGKAQPIDEPVLTPSGWQAIGALKAGDLVLGPDGRTTRVRGVYPQGTKPVVRVTFRDGRRTRCCHDHLWQVWAKRGTGEGPRGAGPSVPPRRSRSRSPALQGTHAASASRSSRPAG